MDLRPPFTVKGKTQILKTRTDGNSSEATKIKTKEPIFNREKRVFGTVRNQNALTKSVTEKPTRKTGIPQRPKKQSIQETDETPKKPSEKNNLAMATAKKKSVNFVENVDNKKILQDGEVSGSGSGAETPLRSPSLVKPKKKSVNFQDKVEENKEKIVQEGDVVSGTGSQTPSRSPFLVKPNVSGTPYQSAERCSKCRFDKLETSSYWIGQIRLSESVGKHFVSASFFKLASECKAEPIRNIKVELKKYLARHEHLSGEKEWKDLCVSYGLVKEESKLCDEDNEEEEDGPNISDQEEEKKQIVEQVTGDPATK